MTINKYDSNHIKKLLRFDVYCTEDDLDEALFDCNVLNIGNMDLIEIQAKSTRCFLFDAHLLSLSNIELTSEEISMRNAVYSDHDLKSYHVVITMLTYDNSIVRKVNSFNRSRCSKNKYLEAPNHLNNLSESCSTSLLWGPKEIQSHNECIYWANRNINELPILFLELEKMSEDFISDLFLRNVRAIGICEDISKIVELFKNMEETYES